MGQIVTLQCDNCGSRETDVKTIVLTRLDTGARSLEIDLCEGCWKKLLAPVIRKARYSARTAGRPQVKFKATQLPPQPGGRVTGPAT